VFFPENLKAGLIEKGLLLQEPERGQPMTEMQAMKLAIQEAYRGLGAVSPNPLVGCVILDSKDRFLSKGYHARYGAAHAEVNALSGFSTDELCGAKVFVTLEPCAHQGKTPSCAKTLSNLPLKEVIFGLIDPNPLVAGKGAEILKSAGISVRQFSELELELEQVCEHFMRNFREQKIFVSAKVASSLDGQLALATGESKWITDSTSREISHLLRAAHDGLLIGSNTLRTDDPSLNVRSSYFPKQKNKIVILDSDALCLAEAPKYKITRFHDPADVYFAISDQIFSPPNPWGAQVIHLPAHPEGPAFGLNLGILLTILWDAGLRSLLVEGGAHVLSSFIREMRAQRLYLFQAPMILGAKSGKAWSERVNIDSMSERTVLKNPQFLQLMQDQLITGILN
jgi:diaminohydroxyphosphoribosylaminopyrimidine deaminase/5-amino-6-(5-phosphoribosylamino)uracil reductase